MTFVSVCCVVKNIPKRVYVLPRRCRRPRVKPEPGQATEPVTTEMVIRELASIMSSLKITNYTTKVVRKSFAFDKKFANKDDYEEIPHESDYVLIEYQSDSSNKIFPADLIGETFVCAFGANTSYTEHLLIDLKIKGLWPS